MTDDSSNTRDGSGQDGSNGRTGDPVVRSPETLSRRSFVRSSAAAVGAGALAFGGTNAASAQSVAQESCEGNYEKFEVGGGDFEMMNNQWTSGSSQQCIYVYDDGSYGWSFQSPSDGPNYPEVYIGERPWGEDTGVPEFKDAQRSDIDELTIDIDSDVNVSGGEHNLALEWWLTDQTIPSGTIPDEPPFATHEIMLVLNHGGGHSHGPIMTNNAINDQFGNTIHHWSDNVTGGVPNAQFHVFVLDQLRDTAQVDLRAIMDYLSDNYGVPSNRYFTGVEIGTEYWPGASGDVTIDRFNVTVNGTTYRSGSDTGSEPPEPSVPSTPTGLSTSDVSTNSITFDWSSVSEANEYEVYVDGSSEGTVSGNSYTIYNLSPGTQYELGVEAVNDAGPSDRATTTETTQQTGSCGGSSTSVNGRTVCDIDDDQYYEDFDADGEATQTDVIEFFQVQHRQSWKQPSMFDFSENGQVGHGDVVALFEEVTGNL